MIILIRINTRPKPTVNRIRIKHHLDMGNTMLKNHKRRVYTRKEHTQGRHQIDYIMVPTGLRANDPKQLCSTRCRAQML